MEAKEYECLFRNICLISNTYRKAEEAKGEYYNLFRVINMTADETAVHSAFIADLLNPKGMHRMGDTFLKLFISRFWINATTFDTANATTKCEKYIGKKTDGDGGRIDIIVTDGNGNAVIIENKIYAADQDKQMVRYHNYAKHNFNAHNLFYLSLYGEVHDGEKTLYDKKLDIRLEKSKDFITLSYAHDILEWLNDCMEKAVSLPPIREAIAQYANLIKYMTGQTVSKEMENDIKNIIFGNKDYIKNLNNIKRAITLSEMQLQEDFWRMLKKKMTDNGQKFYEPGENTANYADVLKDGNIRNYYKNNKNNHYGFEFEIGRYKDSVILYAFRMHTPLKCGILARKPDVRTSRSEPIQDYAEYKELQDFIEKSEELQDYKIDDKGWYLGYRNVSPKLNFRDLDEETLECLTDMNDTVDKIVENTVKDIEAIKKILK